MSTRCMIEFYDGDPAKPDEVYGPGALLYHHSDGYPEGMVPELTTRLKHAAKSGYWWDSERIAGMVVAWSLGDLEKPDTNPDNSFAYAMEVERAKRDGKPMPKRERYVYWGVPQFMPALHYHGDLAYLYRVYLYHEANASDPRKLGTRKFEIVGYALNGNWWEDAPEVPAPDDRLLRLELSPTGLLKSCPVCGLKLTSKKLRDEHHCPKRG